MSVRTATLLGLVLLSFALRIYRLDGQSLWGDEGWAIYHADRESVVDVLRDTRDAGNNPPLYYLALHFWMPVAGRSEFALRYFSFLFGVLAVPAIFVLGRRLGGMGTGIIGALLQTLSPYHIYYSQELRMYAPMVFFVILSSYLFWRLFTARGGWPWQTWAGYAISSGLAVYSHIFAGPVIVAHGLMWLGDLAWRRRDAWRVAFRCLSAQALTLLLFFPWLAFIWGRAATLSGQVQRMGVPLLTILRRCLSDFSAGVPLTSSAPEEAGWPLLIPFLLSLVLALLWPWRRRNAAFLVACLSVPILAIFFVSFPTLPGWTRYFVAASPHYYLLLARGADGLRQFALSSSPTAKWQLGYAGLTALLVAPLTFAQARSLHHYYTDPAYWRWDYRGQIATMAEAARGGAAIVFNGGNVPLLFKYYLPADIPYIVVPSVCDGDEERVRSEIAAVATDYEQVWLVRVLPLPCDYNQRAAQWLNEHTYRVSETWLENNVFSHYLAPARMGAFRPPAQAESVTFDGRFELLEFTLNQDHVALGGTLAVALRWRVLSPMEVNYKFFLALLGPNDEVLSLQDGMPLNWLRPTTLWEAGTIEDDHWGMAVSADTPVGTYPLYVGVYDPATGERLPLLTPDGEVVDDKMLVTEIEVR